MFSPFSLHCSRWCPTRDPSDFAAYQWTAENMRRSGATDFPSITIVPAEAAPMTGTGVRASLKVSSTLSLYPEQEQEGVVQQSSAIEASFKLFFSQTGCLQKYAPYNGGSARMVSNSAHPPNTKPICIKLTYNPNMSAP